MKKNPLFYIVLILGIVLGTFSLQSCLNDDDTDYPTNIPNALGQSRQIVPQDRSTSS